MTLLENIKELIITEGLTIAELERSIGISNGSISKWIHSSPRVDILQKVADYFDVSIDTLLERDNPIRVYKLDIDGLSDEEIEIVRNHLKFAEQLARLQIKEKKKLHKSDS